MNPFPVVDRELRTACRRAPTWWLRCGAATGALVLGLLFYAGPHANPAAKGRVMHAGIGAFMLVLALLSGVFLTADAISSERRNGTLGLLFLTPLRPLDVILGKLASTSLGMAYGLIAAFPVLFIPIFTGGVTAGETARLCLAILSALGLSMAVGIRVSVQSRNSTSAAAKTLLVVVLISLLPVLADLNASAWFRASMPANPLLGLSPVYSLIYSGTAFSARLAGSVYWWSLAGQCLLSLLLVVSACRFLGRHWADPSTTGTGIASTKVRARRRIRPLPLTGFSNPYRWLMRWQLGSTSWLRRFRLGLWVVWLIVTMNLSFASPRSEPSLLLASLACLFLSHILLGLELAFEATRLLQEQQSSGALEQILTTPLKPRWILAGTNLALRGHFARPALVLTLSNVALLVMLVWKSDHSDFLRGDEPLYGVWLFGGAAMSLANLFALRWFGSMRALIDRQPLSAAFRAFAIVHALPWVLFVLETLSLAGSIAKSDLVMFYFVYYIAATALAIALGRGARTRLRRHFRTMVAAGC